MEFTFLILTLFCATNAHLENVTKEVPFHQRSIGVLPPNLRLRRDAVGALDIVTNNEKPIHAEVKIEPSEKSTSAPIHADVKSEKSTVADSPASENVTTEIQDVAKAKSGAVSYNSNALSITEKVPPKDATRLQANYPLRQQSGRKSWNSWSLAERLDLIRSYTRLGTVIVLAISAVIELYPLVTHIMDLYSSY